MKAVAYRQPDVLQLEDVEQPIPAGHEIRIEIHAVSINGSDREALKGKPLCARAGGLLKPGRPTLGSAVVEPISPSEGRSRCSSRCCYWAFDQMGNGQDCSRDR